MNTEELLQELKVKVQAGEISRDEVLQNITLETPGYVPAATVSTTHTSVFSPMKILYALGAAIVVIGIIIFVAQIWDDIGSIGHILVTLGLGLLLTINGSILRQNKPENSIGTVFHFIGGVLIPSGALVTLAELDIDFDTLWPATITFGVIFVFYLLLNSVHKNAVLTFFAILNGTTFIYLLAESLIDGPFYRHDDLYIYLTMVLGLSYLLLGYSFKDGWNKVLVGALYFFGSIGFLGTGFIKMFDSGFWEFLYMFFIIGGIALSIYMRSRLILIISTLSLVGYVSYITGEYFADSFGWPISLILLGFVFIGLGYASVNINKKYISN